MQPLYDTRALTQTLGDIAAKLNVPFTSPNINAFAPPPVATQIGAQCPPTGSAFTNNGLSRSISFRISALSFTPIP